VRPVGPNPAVVIQLGGYAFHELPMQKQSLTQTALNAMRYTSFESLARFHDLQKEALTELIG
jgi:hypothetical protein